MDLVSDCDELGLCGTLLHSMMHQFYQPCV